MLEKSFLPSSREILNLRKMKRKNQFFTILSLFFVLLTAAFAKSPKTTEKLPDSLTSKLQDGDIIFTLIDNPLFRRVAQASGSWESHVGILFQHYGEWWVAESTIPRAKWTPLHRFIQRSEHQKFEIYREKNQLSQAETQKIRQQAESHIGKFYHLGFNYDSPRMYCSKLVYTCYGQIGKPVGTCKTIRQIFNENPNIPIAFWRTYYLGFIPWNRRIVTVKSVLNDPSLRIVSSGYNGKVLLGKKLPATERRIPSISLSRKSRPPTA